MAKKSLPKLDPRLFWDVDFQTDTIHRYPEFVIERVLQRGSVCDFYALLEIYKKDKIRDFLKNNNKFNKSTLSFIKTYFDLTSQDLCSQKPFTPILWKY